jgi:Predicted metal binding domain
VIVVDPEVTRLKFERELERWRENEEAYRRRGWQLLGQEDVHVDIGFLGRLPLVQQMVIVMTACVRVDFTNYDLWPPSVEFIDPYTGEHANPPVQALVDSEEGARDLVVQGYPETKRPFFCVAGIREYHEHPQHSGDSWLLHRHTGEGSLATICDRIWRAMARNVLGIHVEVQTTPGRVQIEARVVNAPGDVAPNLWDEAKRQEQAARAAQSGIIVPQGQVPPEMLGALGLVPAPGEGP